jgi:hypothetical protein
MSVHLPFWERVNLSHRRAGAGASADARQRVRAAGDDTLVALPCAADTLKNGSTTATTCPSLPGFKFLALLGQGPFGEVWKVQAPDGSLRQLRLLPELPGRDPAHERAILDGLCGLSHPAFPHTQLLETESRRLALLTEFTEQTLGECCRIAQAQRLPGVPRTELLGYLWTAAQALDYLHTDEAIYHLTLTPQALGLAGDRLLIRDAGLAELYGVAESLPTSQAARYAAPELLEGGMSAACDQYALALIYCEMLTGLHPLRGQSFQRRSKGRDRPQPALDLLSSGDRRVVARALHRAPGNRYPSSSAFIQALETGESGEEALGQAKTASWSDINVEPARDPSGPDPARTLDRLHQLLAELGGNAASLALSSGAAREFPAGLEHRCGARVYGAVARIKLEGFRQQWRAKTTHVEPARIVFFVPIGASFWRRCLGRQPSGLEIACHFQQPQTVGAQLTEVTLHVRAVHLDAAESERLIKQVAPLLLDSARSYLQATPERRSLERLPFNEPFQVVAVFPGQANGPGVDCMGKDISMRGVGFITAAGPLADEVLIALRGQASEGPILLPAEVVRRQRRADGQHELGARFAFGGFGDPPA